MIAGVQGALPPHRYTQDEMADRIAGFPVFAGLESIVRTLHTSAKVNSRHLILPIEEHFSQSDLGETNDLFIEHAVNLGCEALSGALDEAAERAAALAH